MRTYKLGPQLKLEKAFPILVQASRDLGIHLEDQCTIPLDGIFFKAYQGSNAKGLCLGVMFETFPSLETLHECRKAITGIQGREYQDIFLYMPQTETGLVGVSHAIELIQGVYSKMPKVTLVLYNFLENETGTAVMLDTRSVNADGSLAKLLDGREPGEVCDASLPFSSGKPVPSARPIRLTREELSDFIDMGLELRGLLS